MHEVPRPEPGQHPVARFRAPWKLKAESYVLFLKLGKLPTGTYSLNDHSWADEGMGSFMGGVGTVMIVRYSNTPVGKSRRLYGKHCLRTFPMRLPSHRCTARPFLNP
jgi:hypothetical protein